MKTKNYIRIASAFMVIATVLGAFGAHWLKERIPESALTIWHTAVSYLFYQALGLMFLGLWLKDKKPTRLNTLAPKLLILGTVLFSGSIVLLALKSLFVLVPLSVLGPITPMGGLLMILSWGMIFFDSFS